jgi:hypothetical protein
MVLVLPVASLSLLKLWVSFLLPFFFSWNWVWSHLSYSHKLEGTNGNSSRWAVSGVATFFNSNRKSKVIKRERNKDSKFLIDHQRLPSRSPNLDRGPNSKTPGLVRGLPGRLGHGSTGFCRVVAPDGFLVNPDRSGYWVDRVPSRPTGPV